MKNKNLMTMLRYAAITGNIIFILWVLFHAMDEGFHGNPVEKASAAGLICLLALNCVLVVTLSNNKNERRPITD